MTRFFRKLYHRFQYHSARTNRGTKLAFIPHKDNGYRPHALRSRWLRVYASLVLALKLGVAVLIAFAPNASYVSNITASNIIRLTNESRGAAGLSQLATNGLLNQAAQAKANDMIANGYFAHTSPANISPWDWFQRAGYSYKYAGENLAKDFSTSEDVISAWLASPSHKKNIMNGNYRDIGVAVATGAVNGVTTIVIVQEFGAPLQSTLVSNETPAANPTPPPAPGSVQGTQTPPPPPPPAPVAPTKPVLTSPAAEALLNDSTPTITGTTSPSAVVSLRENEATIAEAPADASGVFSLTPGKELSDGAHSFVAVARATETLLSDPSAPVAIVIDTTPPTVDTDASLILPAWEPRSNLAVLVDVNAEPTSVDVRFGGRDVPLSYTALGYYGFVDTTQAQKPSTSIVVVATDAARNSTIAPIMSSSFFVVDVLEPSRTLTPERLLTVLVTSRTILLALLAFLAIALAMNVFIRIRVQHHPTIVTTLLLMYTIAVMLIV